MYNEHPRSATGLKLINQTKKMANCSLKLNGIHSQFAMLAFWRHIASDAKDRITYRHKSYDLWLLQWTSTTVTSQRAALDLICEVIVNFNPPSPDIESKCPI